MRGEPGAASGKRAPTRSIHRRRHSPKVGILVMNPAARTIMFSRHLAALIGQLSDHRKEWLGAFAEVSDLGGPIVHLGVDVCCVLGIPGRIHIFVPDSLKIRRLRSRS